MIDEILARIAPHHCYGCGITGAILCERCKNYISDRPFLSCAVCTQSTRGANLCRKHRLPYQQLWCVGARTGALADVIDAYKFERVRAAYRDVAVLLDRRLPPLPPDTLVVPIPTTPHNIRRRGYDHMRLVARELAKRRGLHDAQLLSRRNNVTQHFTKSAAERRKQAAGFFELRHEFTGDVPILLIDDIFTTGATVRAGAECLRYAGYSTITAAILVRAGNS